jgi:hypothetical protein
MRSLSRTVVVGALALPLVFAGAGMAAADAPWGWTGPSASSQATNSTPTTWEWRPTSITQVHDNTTNNTTHVVNFGIIG